MFETGRNIVTCFKKGLLKLSHFYMQFTKPEMIRLICSKDRQSSGFVAEPRQFTEKHFMVAGRVNKCRTDIGDCDACWIFPP